MTQLFQSWGATYGFAWFLSMLIGILVIALPLMLAVAMVKAHPALGRDGLIDLPWSPPKLAAKADGPIRYPIGDFFQTNAICRNSPTMRRCSGELVQGVAHKEAAE